MYLLLVLILKHLYYLNLFIFPLGLILGLKIASINCLLQTLSIFCFLFFIFPYSIATITSSRIHPEPLNMIFGNPDFEEDYDYHHLARTV